MLSNSKKSFFKEYFIPISIFIIILLIFFWNVIVSQNIFITGDLKGSDITQFNIPFRQFLSNSLKSNSIPLWTKDIFNGFPILAEGQGGFLYPLNIILFKYLPTMTAFNCSIILSFILVGIFNFLFARSIGISKTGAIISGIIVMLGSFFVLHLKHLNMINSACWVPLILYFIEKYIRRKNILFMLYAGIVFSLQILAGHPQIAYYTIVFLAIYLTFRIITGISAVKDIFGYNNIKPFLSLMLVILIGIGLAAVQLIPQHELKKLSTRSKADYDKVTEWEYSPGDLIMFISPYAYGDPAKNTYARADDAIFWENCAYVGIIPLILSLLAIILGFRKNSYVKILLFSIILLMCLIMNKLFPIFRVLYLLLPGFKLFRFQQRFILFVQLSLSLLAGFGFDYIIQVISKESMLERMGRMKKWAKNNLLYIKYIIGAALILFIVLDLFIFGISHNPAVSSETWLKEPDTVKFLKKDKDIYRIVSLKHYTSWQKAYQVAEGWKGDLSPYLEHNKILPENTNIMFNISSYLGYASLYPERFSHIVGTIGQNINFINDPGWKMTIPLPVLRTLGIGNVKYILAFHETVDDNMELVMKSDAGFINKKINIYKNKLFMPRAYVVPKAIYSPNSYEIGNILVSNWFNPKTTVLIEKDITHGSKSVDGSMVNVSKYSDKEVNIHINMTGDGYLVLSDMYYPGWKVYIDNKQGEILKANYIFRAVAINKGEHEISFVYKPESFKTGAIISILTVMFLFISIYILRRNYINNQGIN